MLISMPTGTSTIFGAFQVIRASRGIMARCLCRSEVKATSASAGAPTVNPNFDLRDYRNNRRSALPAPVFNSLASKVPSLSGFAALKRCSTTARYSSAVSVPS